MTQRTYFKCKNCNKIFGFLQGINFGNEENPRINKMKDQQDKDYYLFCSQLCYKRFSQKEVKC